MLQERKEGEAQIGPSHRTSTSSRAGTPSNSVSYQFRSPPSDQRQLPGDTRVGHSLWDRISFPTEPLLSLCPTGLPQTPLHQLPNCTCHLPSQHLASNSHHPVFHLSRKPGKHSELLSVSLSANNHQSLSPVDSAPPKYSSIPLLSFQAMNAALVPVLVTFYLDSKTAIYRNWFPSSGLLYKCTLKKFILKSNL